MPLRIVNYNDHHNRYHFCLHRLAQMKSWLIPMMVTVWKKVWKTCYSDTLLCTWFHRHMFLDIVLGINTHLITSHHITPHHTTPLLLAVPGKDLMSIKRELLNSFSPQWKSWVLRKDAAGLCVLIRNHCQAIGSSGK